MDVSSSLRNGKLSPLPAIGKENSDVSIDGKASPSPSPINDKPSPSTVIDRPSPSPVGAPPSTLTGIKPIPAVPTNNAPNKNNKETPAPRFAEENMTVANSHSEGMQIFGIGKAGISRAVVIFSKPPNPEPNSVCFQFPNTFLSHAYVNHCIRDVLKDIPDTGFVSLSFSDRNVMHGCTGLDNRWIIRCRNMHTKENLIERGLYLCNKRVFVKSFDDVIAEEYEDYIRYKSHRTKLYGNVHESLRRHVGHQKGTGPQTAMQEAGASVGGEGEQRDLR